MRIEPTRAGSWSRAAHSQSLGRQADNRYFKTRYLLWSRSKRDTRRSHRCVKPVPTARRADLHPDGSPVDVATMSNLDHSHIFCGAIDGVQNPVVALAQAILLFPSQLLAVRWTRLPGQPLDARDDPMPVF